MHLYDDTCLTFDWQLVITEYFILENKHCWIYLLGHTHYILRLIDPNKGFSGLPKEKNWNICGES